MCFLLLEMLWFDFVVLLLLFILFCSLFVGCAVMLVPEFPCKSFMVRTTRSGKSVNYTQQFSLTVHSFPVVFGQS